MFRHVALATALLLVGCRADLDTDLDTDDTDSGEAPIVPGTETVTASWDVDLFSQYPSPTIARFDTRDGRRKLDGMTIAVDHAATMTVYVENGSEIPLVAADYTHEYYLQSIIQLGAVEDENDSLPFFGPGSFVALQAKDLAIADGIEGSGDDFYQEILSDDIVFTADYDWAETPTYLDAMIGTEPLQLVVGGFSESWVYWTDDETGSLLFAGASAVQYSGTMTVTYAYSAAEE